MSCDQHVTSPAKNPNLRGRLNKKVDPDQQKNSVGTGWQKTSKSRWSAMCVAGYGAPQRDGHSQQSAQAHHHNNVHSDCCHIHYSKPMSSRSLVHARTNKARLESLPWILCEELDWERPKSTSKLLLCSYITLYKGPEKIVYQPDWRDLCCAY